VKRREFLKTGAKVVVGVAVASSAVDCKLFEGATQTSGPAADLKTSFLNAAKDYTDTLTHPPPYTQREKDIILRYIDTTATMYTLNGPTPVVGASPIVESLCLTAPSTFEHFVEGPTANPPGTNDADGTTGTVSGKGYFQDQSAIHPKPRPILLPFTFDYVKRGGVWIITSLKSKDPSSGL